MPKKTPQKSCTNTCNAARKSKHPTQKEVFDFIKSFNFQTGDVNAAMKDGMTMLHAMMAGWNIEYFVEAAKFLIAKGADVNAKNKQGHTPLHLVTTINNIEAAKFLIANGADVNAGSKAGFTPLHMAIADKNRIGAAKYLISKGADVNAKHKAGYTLLLSAACEGHIDIVKYLVSKGADVVCPTLVGDLRQCCVSHCCVSHFTRKYFMPFISPTRASLTDKFHVLLDECGSVADKALFGQTFDDLETFSLIQGRSFLREALQEKLQERIEQTEADETPQCVNCKKQTTIEDIKAKTPSPFTGL